MKKMGKETGAKAWLNTEELSMSEAQIEPQILALPYGGNTHIDKGKWSG